MFEQVFTAEMAKTTFWEWEQVQQCSKPCWILMVGFCCSSTSTGKHVLYIWYGWFKWSSEPSL